MQMLWASPQGQQLVIEPVATVLDVIDKNCPGGNGWQPEYDEYYGLPDWVAPAVGAKLIPVGGKLANANDVTEAEQKSSVNSTSDKPCQD